jgi:large subunit ribosomal protein L35
MFCNRFSPALHFPVFMPKMKSHSGAKKRVWKTGSGRYAFKRRGRSHLLLQKSRRQKRINRTIVAHPTNRAALQGLLPNL